MKPVFTIVFILCILVCISMYYSYSTCKSDPTPTPMPTPTPVLKPFGYKIERVKDKDVCVLVNEAPNAKNGVYSNFLACEDALHGLDPKPVVPKPVDPSRPFGFKIERVKDKDVCVLVNEAPNAKNGVYSNFLACDDALPKPVVPKPVDPSRPFGFKIEKDVCVLVNETPNAKNGVYSNFLACEDALHGLDPKPVMGSFGYQFTGKDCSRVSEAPNAKNGVYADMMDCYKETISTCDCKKKINL